MTLVIPSIDIEGGRAVKRVRGRRGTGLVLGDPLELAQRIAAYGFEWLHMVCLDGAERGSPTESCLDALEAAAGETGLRIQFGGGLRGREAVEEACSRGASRLIIGSAWPRRPEILDEVQEAGCEPIAAVEEDRDGRLLVHGWSEKTGLVLEEALRLLSSTAARGVLYTQVWVEGTMSGPDASRLREARLLYPRLLIYSGGVGSPAHVLAAAQAGADAVVVGMALYTGALPWLWAASRTPA